MFRVEEPSVSVQRANLRCFSVVLLSLCLLPSCEHPGPVAPSEAGFEGPVSTATYPFVDQHYEKSLRDRYIVVFNDDVSDVQTAVNELAVLTEATIHFLYEHTIKGFAATVPSSTLPILRRHPLVAYVAADRAVELFVASWGLDRIDQRQRPVDGSFAPLGSGGGVNVYVLDTGLMSAHDAFPGASAITGYPDAFDAFREPTDIYYAEDCWGQDPAPWNRVAGHGTHIGAIAGGAFYGVARGATLISVRVFQCDGYAYEVDTGSGTVSSIIAGIDWVGGYHVKPAVVNLSGGLKVSPDSGAAIALEDAVQASVNAGVTWVVAAGNDNGDACDYSPGRIPETITVAATTSSDARWNDSNWGTCVDLLAPGHEIRSAYVVDSNDNMSTSATLVASGTSMASPHVSGIAAIYLADNPTAAPTQVRSRLLNTATSGVLTGVGYGSPNLLAFTERVLSTGIAGPTQVSDNATYTWDADVVGGDFSYTYEWAWRYHYYDGSIGDWASGGIDSSLTLYVTSGSPHIELRLKVQSGQQVSTSYKYVEVTSCTGWCIESVGGEGG